MQTNMDPPGFDVKEESHDTTKRNQLDSLLMETDQEDKSVLETDPNCASSK